MARVVGVGVVVHLRPTKTCHRTGNFVDEKPVGIKPWLSETLGQHLESPVALFGVASESPRVEGEPRVVVVAGAKRASNEIGWHLMLSAEGKRTAHM